MENILVSVVIFGAAAMLVQSFRASRVLRSVRDILLEPDRAKIQNARAMISGVLGDAVEKIKSEFDSAARVLAQHALRAETLEKKLGAENKALVDAADLAVERIGAMAKGLENLVRNFSEIANRKEWAAVQKSSENFNSGVTRLLVDLEQKSNAIVRLSSELNLGFEEMRGNGRKLSDELGQSIADTTDRINLQSVAIKGMEDELGKLQSSVANDFENVRAASAGIEGVLANNQKLLASQLQKMEHFTDQSKKLLQAQVNTMSDTAARIGTDIRLAESSIDAGADKLNETAEKLGGTARAIKGIFDAIAAEIMSVRAKFQTEVDDFSKSVLASLQSAESASAHAIRNAIQISAELKDSVLPLLSDVNGTVENIEAAKGHIVPLTELMERLESALPALSAKSGAMTDELTKKIADMAEKINAMTAAAKNALTGIGDSTMMLGKLSGESRQQMIDLMADYAKAAHTMRELSGNMAAARAASIPDGIKIPRIATGGTSVQDFVKQVDGIMEKLHDLSVDLTRSVGAEIPDRIMDKYKSGDRAIFSKWFAKMIKSADKKRVREMFRADAVFRSQATQFVHGFGRMLAGAERTDNKEMVAATLLKTDLGIMYQALKACL